MREATVFKQVLLAQWLWARLALVVLAVVGFGILAFSSVPVLNAIGATVGPGAILALLFSAVLVRRT